MKRIAERIDRSFPNAPCVTATYAVDDPVTGKTREIQISFVDDEARQIVPMIPNPTPADDPNVKPEDNLIADPNGAPNLAKLDEFAAARLAEATTAAASVTARMQQAEDARRTKRDADEGARIAKAAEDAAIARKQQLEIEIAELEERKAEAQAAVTKP